MINRTEFELSRIGDKLDKVSIELRRRVFFNTDNLAQRIFNPEIKGDESLDKFYVKCTDWNNSDGIIPELLPHFQGLSEYEKYLIGKLFSSERKILFVEDSIGTGKTTTFNYVRKMILETNCENCPNRENQCLCKKSIKKIVLDHNRFSTVDEEVARDLLYQSLIIEITNGINETYKFPNDEEYITFWHNQLEKYYRYKELTPSSAFSYIASKLGSKYPELIDDPKLLNVEENKEILLEISKLSDKSLYVDYLLRKWGFIIETKYKGYYGCSFIWIDNIDKASIVSQSVLVNILLDCAVDPGPRILVTIRPETFDRLGIKRADNGSNVFDFIDHVSARPSSVVFDRMKRYLENPDTYFVPGKEGISSFEYEQIKQYLTKVFSVLMDRGKEGEYFRLLDLFAGNSKRIALLSAQKLLFVSAEDYERIKTKNHNIIRMALINQSHYQKRSEHFYDPISNIYNVKDIKIGRCLVKLRILQLLDQLQDSCTIGMINESISPFYEKRTDLIRCALNEMLNIYSQLVVSNGLDSFTDLESYLKASSTQIKISLIGKNYLHYIYKSLDYLQEIMYDCSMPNIWISQQVNVTDLFSKLELLNNFLKKISEYDIFETDQFINARGLNTYKEKFGDCLISTQIYLGIKDDFLNLLRKLMSGEDEDDLAGTTYDYNQLLSLRENFIIECNASEIESKKLLT